MQNRYTVAAVIIWNNREDRRFDLGTAPSRRKAKRLGYREGQYHYPLHSSAMIHTFETSTHRATMHAGRVEISTKIDGCWVWAGDGKWRNGQIDDCAADLGDEVYSELEAGLSKVIAGAS